jgi:hypothetical protein
MIVTAAGILLKPYQLFPSPPPLPTDLSKIPTKDCISTLAWAHSVATLTKFCKHVWCADTSNLLLHPEVHLSNHLMKEILDKFSLLESLKVILALYEISGIKNALFSTS